jgi:TorA maturation chaperone TorD
MDEFVDDGCVPKWISVYVGRMSEKMSMLMLAMFLSE